MRKYELSINQKSYTIDVKEFSDESATVEVNGKTFKVDINDVINTDAPTAPKKQPVSRAVPAPSSAPAVAASGAPGAVLAPIPGVIQELYVKEGDEVTEGQKILKMEAMKMENIINAPMAGKVKAIKVAVGDSVNQGLEMVVLS